MKILICVIFFVFVILFYSSSYAASNKVIVIPFEDKTGELGGVEKQITNIVIEQVKKSRKYTFVSAGELFRNWFGDSETRLKDTFGAETAEEIKKGIESLETFRPMFNHGSLGTIFEYKEHWGIDLIIIGNIEKKNESLHIYSEIISIETGRFYSVSTNCQSDSLGDVMAKQTKALLDKGKIIQTVEADREIDHLMSVVSYDIRTLSGGNIQINADYSYQRPDPILQHIAFIPEEDLKEGMKVYRLQMKQKKPIEFKCAYKDGQVEHIEIYADPPSESEGIECTEILSVESQGGYIINFTFFWKDETLMSVEAEPLINPYCAVR